MVPRTFSWSCGLGGSGSAAGRDPPGTIRCARCGQARSSKDCSTCKPIKALGATVPVPPPLSPMSTRRPLPTDTPTKVSPRSSGAKSPFSNSFLRKSRSSNVADTGRSSGASSSGRRSPASVPTVSPPPLTSQLFPGAMCSPPAARTPRTSPDPTALQALIGPFSELGLAPAAAPAPAPAAAPAAAPPIPISRPGVDVAALTLPATYRLHGGVTADPLLPCLIGLS